MDREDDAEERLQNQAFAAIDLGSHTVRLLVAEYRGRLGMAPARSERRITRLAGNFQPEETLKEQGIANSLAALSEFSDLIESMKVISTACGATGVVRRASNSPEFLDRTKALTGISPKILSEEEEALLSAKGVLSVLPQYTGPMVLFDLGGSSTEFLALNPQNDPGLWCTSVFVGAATLTERFLARAPATRALLVAAREAVHASIAATIEKIQSFLHARNNQRPNLTLVGTAGTVTTLAAMKLEMQTYIPHRINGLTLERKWIEETVATLASLSFDERRLLKGLEAGREDVILGGALIALCILEAFHQDSLLVTDAGLLEGLLLDHVESALGCTKTLVSPLTWHPQKG